MEFWHNWLWNQLFNSVIGIPSNTTNITGATNNIAVIKTGGSTQILSGANTYSGGTTVSGGRLIINNTSGCGTGSGTVTVAAAGTLGGSGAISGATTINGTHNAGAPSAAQNSNGPLFQNPPAHLPDCC